MEEEGEADDEEKILCWRRFEGFKEVGVLKDCIRGNHMDMGEFQKYLDQHCLGWVFNELFGIDRSWYFASLHFQFLIPFQKFVVPDLQWTALKRAITLMTL